MTNRFPKVLIACFAVILLSELAVRIAAPHIQPALTWSSWEAQNKVKAMDKLKHKGGASVVFMGTSQVNADIDPALFTKERDDGRPAFNAALNGSDSLLHRVWGLQVIVPRLKPDMVVIGMTTRDINDGGSNKVFDRFEKSKSGKELLHEESLSDKSERIAGDISYLVRYRTVLRHPVTVFRGGDAQERNNTVSSLGVLRAIKIFSLGPYAMTKAFVDRTQPTLVRFHAGGPELQALTTLVRGLKRDGITPVLMDMPVTEDMINLHTRKQADYDAYQKVFHDFATREGVVTLDLTKVFKGKDGFADPAHLNPDGRARLTAFVAKQLPKVTHRS